MHYDTLLLHAGEEPNLKEGGSGDINIPIHLASTFARKEIEKPTNGYEYSRSGNPTRDALEARLAALENAEYGLAFSSGLAAETVLLATLLKSGDHIIASDDLYGGTRRLFERVFANNFNVNTTYVDTTDAQSIVTALNDNTKMIWLETPTNPLLKVSDIKTIADIAKEKNLILVVDNTFLSPYFQRPLSLGAHIVLHSTTKYLNGHSDSVGGALMFSDPDLYQKLKFNQNAIGAILSPFDSYLVLRGIKTLALRMRAHEENALQIAKFLAKHPQVVKIYYPGLDSHPQHELSRRQASGFGGMISFEMRGGLETAKKFLSALRIFALAESLGGVKSLIEHPALMTHVSIPAEQRQKIGISDGLLRISAGIENAGDLVEDLVNGFAAAAAA